MIPLPILLDRVGELSSALSYRHLTIAEVAWAELCEGQADAPASSPRPGSALVRPAAGGPDPALDAEALTFLLYDELDGAALAQLGRNVVAVETALTPLAFAQRLQGCLLDIMEWERELDRIALDEGGLQDFLTASEAVLGNFVNISDSAFRLIAYTRGITLDDPTVAAFIERGYHDEESIARFKAIRAMERWKRQRKSRYHEAPEGKKYPFINYVFHVNSTYYMQMVMTCHRTRFTPGLSAKFDILARHIQQRIRRLDAAPERVFDKSTAFLIDLLRGVAVDPRLLRQQARQLRIPAEGPLRLYELSPAGEADAAVVWSARRIASRLPECQVLPHEDRIFVVSPRRPERPWADDARIEAVLAPLAQADGYVLAASGIAAGLEGLPLAREQVAAARELGRALPFAEGRPALHHFELSLAPWALGRARPSAEALEASARQSILGFLHDGDGRDGDDAAFLLCLYEHHCKAVEAARALGVHRNTVTNRLRALEERFGADLTQPALEQSLRACALLLP